MGVIWLSSRVHVALLMEVQARHPLETGGALLGYENQGSIVVVDAVGPGPEACHEIMSFTPDGDYHEGEIVRAFEQSLGVVRYLGDWHSHPNGGGAMSRQDCLTLTQIQDYRPAMLSEPLMLIYSGRENCWYGWRLKRSRWLRLRRPVRQHVRIFDHSLVGQ